MPVGHLHVDVVVNTEPSQRVKVTPSHRRPIPQPPVRRSAVQAGQAPHTYRPFWQVHSTSVISVSLQLRQPHALPPSTEHAAPWDAVGFGHRLSASRSSGASPASLGASASGASGAAPPSHFPSS